MKSLLRSLLLTMVLISTVYAADQDTRPTDERISVDFPTESRRTIIMNVADHYGLNISWPVDCPDEPTPMKLRNVTWQDIFDLAFAGSDFTYFTRGNIVWVVRIGDQRQLIGKLRDKLNQEVEENMRFRDAVAILIKADAPILSEELRGEIRAFLADPNRSAEDLLKKLGKGQPNQRPETNAGKESVSPTTPGPGVAHP